MRFVTMGVIYPAFDKSLSYSLVNNPIHTLTLGKRNPENHITGSNDLQYQVETSYSIPTIISNRVTSKPPARSSADQPRCLTPVQMTRHPAADDAQRTHLPSIFLTNPQSITNVMEEFKDRLNVHKPDIIGVSETWFSINKPAENSTVPGYHLFHKDRTTRGGGVAIYINDTYTIKRCTIKVPDNIECVWAIISGNFTYNVKKWRSVQLTFHQAVNMENS